MLQGLPPAKFQQPTNKAVPLLADPDQPPPAETLDIQVSVAPTLSLLHVWLSERAVAEDLAAFDQAVAGAVDTTVIQTQQLAGYVARGGQAWPCHLEITPILHPVLLGHSRPWLHLHLLVGPTAAAASDGVRCEVDRGAVLDALDDIYSTLRVSLEERTSDRFRHLDLHWGPPRPSTPFEVLIPPLYEQLPDDASYTPQCAGVWEQLDVYQAPSPEHRAETLVRQRRAADQPWDGPAAPETRVYPFG